MSQSRRRVLVVTGLVALAAAGAVLFVVAAQPSRSTEFQQQVVFPALWTPSYPEDDVPWRGAEVNLEANGAAHLVNAPGGEIERSEGSPCVVRSRDLFTGSARWTIGAKGTIEVSYGGGELILVPDSGKFGSVDWIDVSVPFCGTESAATFGLRSALNSQFN